MRRMIISKNLCIQNIGIILLWGDDLFLREYILPYSDSKYYTYDEISQLSSEDLRIARNEIFARYGYIFSDEGLKEHFANCSWYVPTGMSSEEIESSLNDFEKQNLQLIKQCENE